MFISNHQINYLKLIYSDFPDLMNETLKINDKSITKQNAVSIILDCLKSQLIIKGYIISFYLKENLFQRIINKSFG